MTPIPSPGQRYFYKDSGQEGILELVAKTSSSYWKVKVIDSSSNKFGYKGGHVMLDWSMNYGTWTYLEGQDAPT